MNKNTYEENIEDWKYLYDMDGFRISGLNTKLSEEFLDTFNGKQVEGFLSFISSNSRSYNSVDTYLKKVVSTTEDYFSEIVESEGRNFSFKDFFVAFELSSSAKGIVDGVNQDVSDLIKIYNNVLDGISEKFPEFRFKDRYQLPIGFENYSKLFLCRIYSEFFDDISYHQTVLRRTISKYKDHKKDINELKSKRTATKLAATFLGGIPASIAVQSAYEYFIDKKVIEFEKEIHHLYHSWYILQNSNLNQMVGEDYHPRLQHLYLSTLTGMLCAIQDELNQVGYQILEVRREGHVSIGLSDGAQENYVKQLNDFLFIPVNENNYEVYSNKLVYFMSTLNKLYDFGYSFENTYDNFVGKLMVRYIELQSLSLQHTNSTSKTLNKLIESLNLDEHNYSFIYDIDINDLGNLIEIVQSLTEENQKEWALMFADFVKNNNLNKGKLLDSNVLVLSDNILNNEFLKMYYLSGGTEFISEKWTNIEFYPDKNKIETLKLKFETQYVAYKRTILNKIFKKPDPLQIALNTNDLLGVETRLSKEDSQLTVLEIDDSLFIHPNDLIFFSIYNQYALNDEKKKLNIKIKNSTLEKIVESEDWSLIYMLLEVGFDPLYVMDESTYFLNYVLMNGSSEMVSVTLNYISKNFKQYEEGLTKILRNEKHFSPYFFVFASGYGYMAEVFPEIFTVVPLPNRKLEYNLACVVFDEINLNAMTLSSTFDLEILMISENSDINPILSLGINHCYHTMSILADEYPGVFEQSFNGRPILYYFYEAGYAGMTDFYYDVLEVKEFGGISVDDIMTAIWRTQNRAYLKEMNKMIVDVEGTIKDEIQYARNNGFYVIEKMLKDVLK